MKKLFIKSLMTVGVAGLVGLTSVAMAAEANIYGSIRAGIASGDDNALDIGAAGLDGKLAGQGVYGRIGIKGSTDLGNGQSAGGLVELGVAGTVSVRHQNVWIGGGWGKLTVGQQGNPYRGAANWDQSWTLGGQIRHNDGGSRLEGLKYSSNLAGPFSFDLTLTGNDEKGNSIDRFIATAHYDFGLATVNVGINQNKLDSVASKAAVVAITGTASSIIAGSTDTTVVTLVEAAKAVDAAPSWDSSVISVNGSAGGLGWYLGYETSKPNGTVGEKVNITGLFLSYALGDSDKIYFEHEKEGGTADSKSTLFGYSHSLGDGVTFIAEHLTSPTEAKVLNLVVKYDF